MSISVDETIWEALPEQGDPNVKSWHDGNGVTLVLNSIGFDRDLYAKLFDETEVRKHFRDHYAEQNIGIVECDVLDKNGTKIVKTIGKNITSGQPALYLGSLAIPLSDRSYVFSLYAREEGITGVRDTVIFAKLVSEGQMPEPDPESERIPGWVQDPYFQDPYFPEYQGPCLRNLSELEEYDHQFPDHPLSKVRFRINELAAFITPPPDNTVKNEPW